MMYGADPDPYGAVPPYRIGYDTYTPNYPSIPGVPNSFAPNMPVVGGGAYAPQYASTSADHAPSVAPGVVPTGTPADYNYYYERDINGDGHNTPATFGSPNPFMSPSGPPQTSFYGRLTADMGAALPAMPTGAHPAFGFGFRARQAQTTNPLMNRDWSFRHTQAPIGTRPDSGDAGTSQAQQTGHNAGPSTFSTMASRHLINNAAREFVPASQSGSAPNSALGATPYVYTEHSGGSEIMGRNR